MNPRVALWLRAHGMTEADIARDPEGDSRRVTVGEHTLPWTILYGQWIRAQWRAWGQSFGFRGDNAHEDAERAGKNRNGEFDAWLRAQVENPQER